MNLIERKTLAFFVKTNGNVSRHFFGGVGHIFMLHRVLPPKQRNQFIYNKDLAITPDFLSHTIAYLQSRKFQFVSLDEATEILTRKRGYKKKFICFTLDDGYRDNILFGLPIFKKYNVPFTIYVTNSFPNHTAHLWWYWLEELVLKKNTVTINTKTYVFNSESEKQVFYNRIRDVLKNATLEQRTKIVRDVFHKNKDAIASEVKDLALSWHELQQIQRESLVTIGAHTSNHLSLGHLDLESVISEIQHSKEELEANLGCKMEHFAYPYGGVDDATPREFNVVADSGFKTATLNFPGNVFFNHLQAMMALPRYPLSDATDMPRLEMYLNGIRHFSANGFKKRVRY